MSWNSHDQWRPYVPVAERRRQAAKLVARMKKSGREVRPVEISGRKITRTFWGDAWCNNLEAYSDYANRLPRGRTYARNGSVIDLQIEAGQVHGLVSGSELYEVKIEIKPLARKRWTGVKRLCAGQIDSLIELLKGSISKGVMEVVSKKGEGLFPSPGDISLSCSCPDWATMCKHVAATLYGVGARLDHEPDLLFTLRGVDPAEMVEAAVDQPPTTRKSRKARVLETDELSSVFGIDIDLGEASRDASSKPAKRTRKAASGKKKQKAEPAARKAVRKGGGSAGRLPDRGRPVKTPRPKAARLTDEALERLHVSAAIFVEQSAVLCDLVDDVQLSRGRFYFWRKQDDLMARITPLGPRSMLLESPRGNTWTEHQRGQLATVLKVLERDPDGAFHDSTDSPRR
jgi:uncharacterized Zn finger protein